MISHLPPFFVECVLFLFGAIFGSFANVIILRLPEKQSLLPSSACPHCHKKISWYENVPILGWLLLRGRCSKCKKKISVQYLIVEVLMGLLFTLAYVQLGWSWFLLEILIFIFAAVTASFIDLKHYILPDVFTLGGLCIGLLGALVNPERSFWDGFWGFLVGGGFLYLTAYVHYLMRKVEGLGGGDIKLVAWIGSLMGWQSLIFVFTFASVAGVTSALGIHLMKGRSLKDPIPFGPFLTAGAIVYVLFFHSSFV